MKFSLQLSGPHWGCSMAPIVPVNSISHSIPDWRFWIGTESDRRYILQVWWRQDSCEVDLPRGNDRGCKIQK